MEVNHCKIYVMLKLIITWFCYISTLTIIRVCCNYAVPYLGADIRQWTYRPRAEVLNLFVAV